MVRLTDTTLRDGHQSLIATRMRTEHMIPILEELDKIGFYSLEVWGGATFDVCLRFLNEDPWERLREIKRHTTTPLQMLLRGRNLVGYRPYPESVIERFVHKSAENGIHVFRIFDALNDFRNVEFSIRSAKKTGAIVEGAIVYTISPVHTLRKYVDMAQQLASLECDNICLKDMAGIMGPADSMKLVKAIKKEVALPIHIHTHCTSGMAMMTYLAACEAGASILDTAFTPFSGGSSQPPVESVVAALQGTPFETGLDLKQLVKLGKILERIWKENYEKSFDARVMRVDPNVLIHQIPGGMITNLIAQLKGQPASLLDQVLEEVPRVRHDLGYPPLVTPMSQIVGTQALFNVLSGERYKIIPKELRDYVKGGYGTPPGQIDQVLQTRILKQGEIGSKKPESSIDDWQAVVNKVRTMKPSASEEEILTFALFPEVASRKFDNSLNPANATASPPMVSK